MGTILKSKNKRFIKDLYKELTRNGMENIEDWKEFQENDLIYIKKLKPFQIKRWISYYDREVTFVFRGVLFLIEIYFEKLVQKFPNYFRLHHYYHKKGILVH